MEWRSLVLAALTTTAIVGMVGMTACTKAPTRPLSIPRDGSTEVVLENHLPDGFHITSIALTMDGEPIQSTSSLTADTELYHAKMAVGAHTLEVVCEVRVPCGLSSEPYEKLTATISRSFEVGPSGGLVNIDAFAESAWLNPSERVHLLVSLRGLGEGRVLYGQSKDAKQACGRLGRLERSRCIVERLTDRARAQHDVAGLLCEKDKLEAIDDALTSLDLRDQTKDDKQVAKPVIDIAQRRHDVEGQVDQLERQAEYCVSEDLSQIGDQKVTSDRSACARYDDLTAP